MASFPLTNFRAINLKMNDPSITFRSQNGRRVSRKVGGHLWSFTLTFPPMTKEKFRPVIGFIAGLRGSYSTFTVVPPNLAVPQGHIITSGVIGTAAAGATQVDVSNNTGGTIELRMGDIIKFSNHNKVYMLTTDVTIVDGQNELVGVSCPLLQSVSSTPLTNNQVPFTVALNNDLQEIKTEVNGLYTFELDVTEVY